jgi:hypothetical protein
MQDNLTQCKHCGSQFAYESIVEGKSYEVSCLGCGFTTNNYLLEGTEELKSYLESLPRIYAELATTDEDGLCWVPMSKDIYGKGSLYAAGVSNSEWYWVYAPYVELKEGDPEAVLYKLPDGTLGKYKVDFKNQEFFGKEQFLLALQRLDYFGEIKA